DKAAFIKEIVDGPYDYLTISTEEQTITIAGKNAVVRHRFNVQATNDGAPASLTLGVLMVFQKQGKSWKLLARQGYKL
ncbi:MAG: nuclear transport factor 2 family protein, partial [Flavobacteriaceae bacterium]